MLELGNAHKDLPAHPGHNCHEWTIILRQPQDQAAQHDLAELVDHVVYDLHPTFCPSQVQVAKPPFTLTRIGWGVFDVGVTVHWKKHLNQPISYFTHRLSFRDSETSALVPVA